MTAETNDAGDDVVITDRELFDQAISPTPPPEPPQQDQAPPQAPPVDQPAAVEAERQRDAQGRFTRQPQQQLPPQAAAPQAPVQVPPQVDQRTVPLREILDEREKRQRAENELQQMRLQWQQLEQQAAAIQRQQTQQQAPQTIFDAPEQYLASNVVTPILQQMEMGRLQSVDGLSRAFANQQYRKEVVDTALAELAKVRYTPDGDHTYRQIMSSGHPYGELVEWYNRSRAHQTIGADPAAWLRQQQQAWVRDPNAQRAVIEYLRQQQQQQPQASNVKLPPSLSSVPASSGAIDGVGDLSDASLYAYATKAKR